MRGSETTFSVDFRLGRTCFEGGQPTKGRPGTFLLCESYVSDSALPEFLGKKITFLKSFSSTVAVFENPQISAGPLAAPCYAARAMALIEFRDVKKAFGPKRVYRGLNLQVHSGETLTVIGGSGQGKSVMLKMLVGLLSVDEGSIHFDGERIDQGDAKQWRGVRRRIAMLFQGAALFDSLSVGDNVAYGMREHGTPEGEIDDRVEDALSKVGMSGAQKRWPASLSAGMKKRVGLARAIAVGPEVLLYDEPTTGLDPINISRITDLIVELQSTLNITSIAVTHDMPSAFKISHRIAMIQGGEVIFTGQPADMLTSEDARVRDFVEGNASEEEETVESLLRSGV